ncbi:hypothetical protein AB0G02_18860 [Actinosynnema sp. NPDC023658]|uniref:hypothetical protein n=1 Tax=Actinosynnema sp. NPDC023658 TaxID=3155465 RepID=UPI0033F8DFCD
MERRKLVAVLGGLVLIGGAVVVLRNESAPPVPEVFERSLADGVEYVPDTRGLVAPTDLVLTALDRTSLRASWTAGGGLGHGGFEVRWNGGTRLVRGTETELTDLDANADVTVEVRALDALGTRSAAVTAQAAPRLAYDEDWLAGLMVPLTVFDGPAPMDPRRWRVLDNGDTDCLGLRPLNGKRLEITCDRVDLQSNAPVRLRAPGEVDERARASLTTDGPIGHRPGESEMAIALLPEPFGDLGPLAEPFPPGAVVLRVTQTDARFVGDGVTSTETGATYPPPTPGVRHRWELRVLTDSVVALRDGVEVAKAPVAVPWTTARARLVFRQADGTIVDTFGTGGLPAYPLPESVVPLGPGVAEGGATSLGNVASPKLEGASSVRVVASVVAGKAAPITVELGTRSAPALPMRPDQALDDSRPSVVYADFPLPSPDRNPKVRLRAEGEVTVHDAHLVVAEGPDARRPLPQLTDRALPAPEVPAPAVSVLHESGDGARFPPDPDGPRFPGGGGRLRATVELTGPVAREIAAIKGLEVDLDGDRIAVLPTNGSAGGRHEFVVDLDELSTGRHQLVVRVLPVDERRGVQTQEQSFEIRPL